MWQKGSALSAKVNCSRGHPYVRMCDLRSKFRVLSSFDAVIYNDIYRCQVKGGKDNFLISQKRKKTNR